MIILPQARTNHRRIYRPPGVPRLLRDRMPRGLDISILPALSGPGPQGSSGIGAQKATIDLISGKGLASTSVLVSPGQSGIRATQHGSGMFNAGASLGSWGMQCGIAKVPGNIFSIEALSVCLSSTVSHPISGFNSTYPCSGSHDRSIWIQSGVPKFFIFNGSSIFANSSITIAQGQLAHIVGTSDGSTIRIYVNGKLGASQGFAGTAYAGNTFFYCGTHKYPDDGNASGDSVILLSNYATACWSAQEVADRYADPFGYMEFPGERLLSMLTAVAGGGINNAMLQTAVSMGGI